ncbi:MAG: dihydroorotate dehydrogenase-like protein [Spirochaetales bacterium]
MIDLTTNFMGLKLSNPIVVAASGLTGTPEGVEKAVQAGAGAVVLKSLFEEQILAELGAEEIGIDLDAYPEAEAFISRTAWENGTEAYLQLIKDSKAKSGDTPIFASINCVGTGTWASFTKRIEEAGADALELNIAYMPHSTALSSKDIEAKVLATVKEARLSTRLPLQVKLGSHYSSLPHLANSISKEGANALVLFNRFYRFDIDIGGMKLMRAQPLSTPEEYHESLRWIALLYQRAGIELAGTTGIHDAETAAKFILAGASVAQVCSVIYKGGWKAITGIIDDLKSLMEAQGFSTLDAMRGKLSAHNSGKPDDYMRLQYIKALTGIS